MKQLALHLLRKARLLPAVESANYLLVRAKNRGSSLPASAYDAYGSMNLDAYLVGGKPIAKYLAALTRPGRILEWGCGPGRIIRHLPELLPSNEIWGCDYNQESIEWCKANIEGASFATNSLMPPTGFPDRHFSSIYAVSVFTHLSEEAHFAWAKELDRLLQPNGNLICTFHGNASVDGLFPNEMKKYKAGELVIRGEVLEGSRCFLAYHPEKFIRRLFSDFSVQIFPAPNGLSVLQDVWIFTKS